MYKQFFGFCSEPFASDIETTQLFKSESYKELQKRFDYICAHRGIMLLSGTPGAGKTTAIRALLSKINKKIYYPIYLPLSTVSVFEFYRQLNTQLGGQEAFYKTDIYKSIQIQIMEYVSSRNLTPIIVLDEAHLLKESNFQELQIITNFKMDSYMPAIFILAGQPLLAKRVRSYALDSFNQRITIRHELLTMTEEECQKYIKHQLTIAGRADRILTDAACRVVFQISKGVARVIGRVVVSALIVAAEKSNPTIDENDVLDIAKEVF
jgi:type II secretory pathway predicted ATPase ExeA